MEQARTVGELRRAGYQVAPVREEMRRNLLARLAARRAAPAGHHRLRRHGHPRDRERDPLRPPHRLPRRARPGEDRASSAGSSALLDRSCPAIAGCEIHDDPFAPICRGVPAPRSPPRATRSPIAWIGRDAALRREARDARRLDRRPDRRDRSRSRSPRAASSPTRRRSTTGSCRAPTAASSPSTSCPTSPRRCRSASST